MAVDALSRNKAVGPDLLKDTQLCLAKEDDLIVARLTNELYRWYVAGTPSYVKRARIVTLSKTTSQYPPVGQVRPIAILPAITKLYEQIIMCRLQKELSQLDTPLHPRQRGFTKGKSTHANLADICSFIMKALSQA